MPKPPWLKVRPAGGERYHGVRRTLREHGLYTVCEAARCPNVGECWRAGTATVMLLGELCTRGCRFCAVRAGNPRGVVDALEPERVARAIAALRLDHVVLTMVTRDDLPDGGAGHVAATVRALRTLGPELRIEALVGDFAGSAAALGTVLGAAPDVLAHNVEVVRSVTGTLRDRRCDYDRSLELLHRAKQRAPDRLTKSSLMVGVGESDDEVLSALADLRSVGVDLVTIGQYLQPTAQHAPVTRFVPPAGFAAYRRAGLELGFAHVASGPLVRSSYRAAEQRGRTGLPQAKNRVSDPGDFG